MLKAVLTGVVLVLAGTTGLAQDRLGACLHGANETPADRARRQQAIQFAVKVNLAETTIIGLAPQFPQKYRPLGELPNLPPLPSGFTIQFHLDDRGYLFSLKDMSDSCRYAIFSDQDRLIYEALARTGGLTIPLGTK